MVERFCNRTEFSSYEDFKENFRIIVPENFNYAYDVVDEWAKLEPDKRALVWCDDRGNELTLSFSDISRISKKTASALQALGIRRGDSVRLLEGHFLLAGGRGKERMSDGIVDQLHVHVLVAAEHGHAGAFSGAV